MKRKNNSKQTWTSILIILILNYNSTNFNIIRNGDGTISFVEFVMFYEKGKYKEYL